MTQNPGATRTDYSAMSVEQVVRSFPGIRNQWEILQNQLPTSVSGEAQEAVQYLDSFISALADKV